MSELTAGSTLAGLRIEGVLGRGGMGVVYRALDPELDRRVAVKVITGDLAADADFRRRFRRESRAAASVHHPHVIPIHRAGEVGGQLFLVMQHIAGTDLRELIERSGGLDPVLVGDVVEQVAGALDAAHRLGLVHCDVKPANVLVEDSGDGPHAYLTDFGLTRQADASDRITQTGVLLGSFEYMAPELFDRSSASVASDVYALGCMAFHALSGSVPYPRPNLSAMIAAHLHAPLPTLGDAVPDPGLRAALDSVVATAMAKRPADRYPSAGALATALHGALRADGRPPEVVTVPRPVLPPGEAGVPRGGPTVPAARPTTGGLPPVPAGPRFVPAPGGTAQRGPGPTTVDLPRDHPRPLAAPRSAPPTGTGPDPEPTPATTPPSRRARWRAAWIAGTVLLVGAALAAVLVLVPLSGPDATAAPPAIVLDPPTADGDTVRLAWSGPDTLDYSVEFSTAGTPEESVVVGRTRTTSMRISAEARHCFQVRGSDGRTVYRSNVQPLNGAACEG